MNNFFKNPTYGEQQKLDVLLSIFPGLTTTTKSFLKILTERSHLSLLSEVSDEFTRLLSKFKNIMKIKNCRNCNHNHLIHLFSLGKMSFTGKFAKTKNWKNVILKSCTFNKSLNKDKKNTEFLEDKNYKEFLSNNGAVNYLLLKVFHASWSMRNHYGIIGAI